MSSYAFLVSYTFLYSVYFDTFSYYVYRTIHRGRYIYREVYIERKKDTTEGSIGLSEKKKLSKEKDLEKYPIE